MHKADLKKVLKGSGGRVTGTGIVRDKDGNIKGTVTFDGTTSMSKEELEAALGHSVEETPSGTDTSDSGA